MGKTRVLNVLNVPCCSLVIASGLDAKKIDKCMGDRNADSDNPVLKEEQNAQVIVCYSYSSV
jgi:hypothetical protein